MYFLEIRTIAIIDSVNDIASDTHRIQGVVLYLVSKYLPIIKLNITGPIIQPDTLPKTCKYSLFNNDCFFCLSLLFSIKRKGLKPCTCAWTAITLIFPYGDGYFSILNNEKSYDSQDVSKEVCLLTRCACAWNRTKDLCLIRTAFYH